MGTPKNSEKFRKVTNIERSTDWHEERGRRHLRVEESEDYTIKYVIPDPESHFI